MPRQPHRHSRFSKDGPLNALISQKNPPSAHTREWLFDTARNPLKFLKPCQAIFFKAADLPMKKQELPYRQERLFIDA